MISKKFLLRAALALIICYTILCLAYYFLQESFLFTHTRSSNNNYTFPGKYEERDIKTRDGIKLNGLLFKADSAKGLIFYLHGGGHTLEKWGGYAKTYTDLHYDIFFLDYRGFGKSEGSVPTEKQLYNDVQDAYDNLKAMYKEKDIVVLGYSFGTAAATMLAANNKPKILVLQAPYYSGAAAVENNYPFLSSIFPSFLLKYKLPTYRFIKEVKAPVIIFHGNMDSTFNVNQSYKLKQFFKPGDELIILDKQGHNGFTENPEYIKQLTTVLSKY